MLTLYHIVSVLGHIASPMFFIFGVIGFIVVAYTNNKKINSAVCDTICAICGFGICISIIIGLIVFIFSIIFGVTTHSSIKKIYPDAHNFHYIKHMDLSSFDYDNDTIYYKYDSSKNRIVIYDIDMDKENIINDAL